MHAKQFGPSPGLVTLRLLNPSRAKESFASSPRRSARPFCSCVPNSPKSLTPPHMIPTSFQGPLGPEPNIPGNSRSRAHGVARNPWDSGRKTGSGRLCFKRYYSLQPEKCTKVCEVVRCYGSSARLRCKHLVYSLQVGRVFSLRIWNSISDCSTWHRVVKVLNR